MPVKEALQFDFESAVDDTAAGNAFGSVVQTGFVRYVYRVEAFANAGAARRIDYGYTNDNGVTSTLRGMMYLPAAAASAWRPGYEDGVDEDAGPIFTIPAGYQFIAFVSTALTTAEVWWVYEDKPE